MEDVFRVGVELALGGSAGAIIQKWIQQMDSLDRAIQRVQGSANGLVSSMRAANREARSAATAWREAASAMDRAARSARAAAAATPKTTGGTGGATTTASGSSAARRGPLAMLGYNAPAGYLTWDGRNAVVPYAPGSRALVPYDNGRRDFTMLGGPYTPYGTGIPGRRPQAPPGGALVPGWGGIGGGGGGGGGFTMNGGPYTPGGGPVGPYNPNQIPLARPWGPQPYLDRHMAGPSSDRGIGGLAAAGGAYGGAELLGSIYTKGAKLEDLENRLAAQGFNAAQIDAADKAAFSLQRTIKPTTVTGNLKLLSEIMATVQNADESLKLLPEFAQLEVLLGRAGNVNGAGEMLAAIKAGEYRGVLTKRDEKTGESTVDTPALGRFIQGLLATSVITGGTVDPRQMLQFLRASNYAGANISDTTFFARELALIQALGASGAGRSLQGFIQQFGAGKMSEGAANLLLEMGIIQGGGDAKSNPYLHKLGMGQFFLDPKGMPAGLQLEASETPDKFIAEYLFPKIRGYLAKHLGDQYTKADAHERSIMEMNFAGQIASRQPGGRELAETIRVMALMDRDEKAYAAALNRPIGELLLKDNPVIASKALDSSVDAFLTMVSKPSMQQAVGVLDNVTSTLNSFGQWAEKHGEITKIGLDAVAGAVVALGVAAGAAGLAALGPIGVALVAIGAFAPAAAAGLEYFDAVLKKRWPSFFNDKGLDDIRKQGGVQIPAWAQPFGGLMSWDEFKKVVHEGMKPHLSSAPPPSVINNRADPEHPIPVHITNADDLVHGISSGQAKRLDAPSSGISGPDIRIDTGAAYLGAYSVP